jgi:hypothetical protein
MVYFQTKSPNLAIFCGVLGCKMLVNIMIIWNILQPSGIFCGRLVQFVFTWHSFSVLVCLDREKSGNPGRNVHVLNLELRFKIEVFYL